MITETVLQDEAKHGSSYDSNGKWIGNSLLEEEQRKQKMAEQPGSIRPEVLARKEEEMKSKTPKSEPAVAGDAEEATSEAKPLEVRNEVTSSKRAVSSAVKYPERKCFLEFVARDRVRLYLLSLFLTRFLVRVKFHLETAVQPLSWEWQSE